MIGVRGVGERLVGNTARLPRGVYFGSGRLPTGKRQAYALEKQERQ